MAIGTTASVAGSPLEVVRVPMFENNYGWLLRDTSSGDVAVVDPGEPGPIERALDERGWALKYILNTHHHKDHVGGNAQLKARFGCSIIGPKADEERIPQIDMALADGETCCVGSTEFSVIDTPGHTKGHITFWAPSAASLFPGDTIFAMGCGRLFEGTPQQMWASLCKLKALPKETLVFCAHEYTLANAKWAMTVEPNNTELQARVAEVHRLRAEDTATVPTTLALEAATNPFLRPNSLDIRQTLSVSEASSDADAFSAIRRHKDTF